MYVCVCKSLCMYACRYVCRWTLKACQRVRIPDGDDDDDDVRSVGTFSKERFATEVDALEEMDWKRCHVRCATDEKSTRVCEKQQQAKDITQRLHSSHEYASSHVLRWPAFEPMRCALQRETTSKLRKPLAASQGQTKCDD